MVGGGSVWTADGNAVVRRLGPPQAGQIPDLHLAWYDSSSAPPFLVGPLRWTPAAYDGRALVLDFRKNLFAIDPATGAGEMLATLPSAGTLIQIEPVVASDTLLTVQDQTLQAFDLRSKQARWQVPGAGPVLRPPVVAGDLVLWVSGKDQDGTMLALDLATGVERWRAPVPGAGAGTTVLRLIEPLWPEDGVLVVPAAEGDIVGLDAATGAERWRFHPPAARLGDLTVTRGRVWLLLENARVYVLDVQDGQPVARFAEVELNLNTQGFSQRPMVVGDHAPMAAGLALFGFDVPGGTP